MLNFQKVILVSTISILLSPQALASAVRSDMYYQAFRDFALNKGAFVVGATNIPVKNAQGRTTSTMLPNISMPDFGSVNKGTGIATLIDPQYIVSVAHNGGYQGVSFGETGQIMDAHTFNYRLTDRNNYPTHQSLDSDYHMPRLHKMVTEVRPTKVSEAGLLGNTYINKERFPVFIRVGSGTQAVRDINKKQYVLSGGYNYLTGGTSLQIKGGDKGWLNANTWVYNDAYGKMTSYGMQGDSGSPLFVYDTLLNKWVLVGVLVGNSGTNGTANKWAIVRPDYHQQQILEDVAGTLNSGDFVWTASGKDGQIVGVDGQSVLVGLANGNDLNHGKNITFNGTGSLTLNTDINQGAGGLYFKDDFTVKTSNDSTHLGAGVVIADGKRVNWQVKNPKGDRLSKLGKGTLYINGTGQNLGDISVGEGTVILNQQTDGNGNRQAFNKVGLTSGRGTVILGSKDQVNPDNIYFGYKGGRLDVNGNDLNFKHIQNVDDGAKIVNNNIQKSSNITIGGYDNRTVDDIVWGKWSHGGGELYEYINPYANHRTDYFKLKGDPRWFYPTNQTGSKHWEFLGSDKNEVIKNHLAPINEARRLSGFNGVLGETDVTKYNGVLNVNVKPILKDATLLLSGGSNLNGDLTVFGGKVVLSGRPTPYATGKLTMTVNPKTYAKTYSYDPKYENIHDNDWINRIFIAKNFIASNDSTLTIGRNVSRVLGNFKAMDNAVLNLGIGDNGQHCIRSDQTGRVNCHHAITEVGFNLSPKTDIEGNLTLESSAVANIGKAHMVGQVQGGTASVLNMDKHAVLTLTDDSRMGTLNMMQGASIHLNDKTDGAAFHKLYVDHLKGDGKFYYTTNIANNEGDKLYITGTSTGTHTLLVANTGVEPTKSKDRLTLVSTDPNNVNTATFVLENGRIDVGALRYELIQDGGNYRLYNPIMEQEVAKEEEKELQMKEDEIMTKKEVSMVPNTVLKRSKRSKRSLMESPYRQIDVISRYTNTAVAQRASDVQTVTDIARMMSQEITQVPTIGPRVWAKIQYANNTFGSNDYQTYDKQTTTTFVGAENTLVTGFGGATAGIAVGNVRASYNFDNQIKGSGKGNLVNFYGRANTKSGMFVGGVLGAGVLNNKLVDVKQLGKTDSKVVSASLTVGKTFKMSKVDITPSITIDHASVSANSHTLDGAVIQANKIKLNSQTANLKILKQLKMGKVNLVPYAGISYTFNDNQALVNVNGYDWQNHTKDYRYVNAGISVDANKVNATAFIEQQLGDNRLGVKNPNVGLKIEYQW